LDARANLVKKRRREMREIMQFLGSLNKTQAAGIGFAAAVIFDLFILAYLWWRGVFEEEMWQRIRRGSSS